MRSLPDSLGDWPPFPDTVAALRRLKTRYKLAVISNTDDDLFARTAVHLEVPFDAVITAQQARSYKPSTNNFRLALERLGVLRRARCCTSPRASITTLLPPTSCASLACG